MENSPPQIHRMDNSPPQFNMMNSPPQIRFLLNNSSGGPGPHLQVVHAVPYFPSPFMDTQPFSSHLMGEAVAGPSPTPAVDTEESSLKNSPTSNQMMGTASSCAPRSSGYAHARMSSFLGRTRGPRAARKYVPSIVNSGFEARSEEPNICIGSVFSLANMDDVSEALCPDPPVVTAVAEQSDKTLNPSRIRDLLNAPPVHVFSTVDSNMDAAASSSLAATTSRTESPSSISAVSLNHDSVSNASSTEPSVAIQLSEAATNRARIKIENYRRHSQSSAQNSMDSQESNQEPVTQAAEKVPEVVDLEKEDIDDCMLVKIDLSKLYFPYGSKIHNTEVVIEDSDHEEEINPSGSSNLPNNALQDDAASIVPEATESSVVAADTRAVPASNCSSPLAMEVDEIENEAEPDNISGNKSDNEDIPSDTEDTPSDTEGFSRTDLQYSDDRNETISISVIRISEKKHNGEDVLNELLSDASNERDTPTSESENNTLNQLIPTTVFGVVGAQQSLDPSVPVISMVQSCSTDPSLVLPELHASQDQSRQPSLYKSSVSSETCLPSPNIVLKVPMIVKSAHSASKELVTEDDKACQNESVSIGIEPRAVRSKVRSDAVMCKLCYYEFPTRVELVTHTWNCHRFLYKSSNSSSHQCEHCAKTFGSDSLMRLHQKVMCPSKDMQRAPNKVTVNSVDRAVSTLSFPNAISKKVPTINASQVQQQKQQLCRDKEPGQSEASSSDQFVASNPLFEAHVKLEPGVISVDECSNSNDSLLKDSDVGAECSSSLPHTNGGGNNQIEFLPGNSSSTWERGVTPNIDVVKSEIISIPDDQSDTECGRITQREEEPLECTHCNKKFVNSSDLVWHKKKCQFQEVFSGNILKCFICDKGFSSAYLRYQHMLINTKCKDGIKLFCSKCEASFWKGDKKRTHIALSKDCWKYEMDLMEIVLKNARSGMSEMRMCADTGGVKACSGQEQGDNNSVSNGSTQIDNIPSKASAGSSSLQDEARDSSSGWEAELSTHKLAVTLRKENLLPTVTSRNETLQSPETSLMPVTSSRKTPLPLVTPSREPPLSPVYSSRETPLPPVMPIKETPLSPVASSRETPLLPVTPSRETPLPHVNFILPVPARIDIPLPRITEAVPLSSYGNFKCRKCHKSYISSAGLLKHLYASPKCHAIYNSSEAGKLNNSDQPHLTFKQREVTLAPSSGNLATPVQTKPSCQKNESNWPDDSSSSETESSSSPPTPCTRKTTPDADVRCPGCRNKFPSKAVLMLHLNSSFKCRRKVIQTSKVAKRTPLVLNKSPQQRNNFKVMVKQVAENRAETSKSGPTQQTHISGTHSSSDKQGSADASKMMPTQQTHISGTHSSPDKQSSVDASKMVPTQQSHISGTHSSPDKQGTELLLQQKTIAQSQPVEPESNSKSSIKVSALNNICKVTQKSLRVVIKPVSVMCSTCHSAFKDDAGLARHLSMNQNCLKKSKAQNQHQCKTLVDAGKKRDGKKKSCEIVTGINDSTSFVSIVSSRDGCLSLQEQPQQVSEIGQRSLYLGLSPTTQADHSNSRMRQFRKISLADDDNDESDGKQDDHRALSDISSDGSDESSDSDDSKDKETSEEYVCKPCKKSFSGKPSFDKHKRDYHQPEQARKVHCKVCTRKFSDLTCLQAHLLQFRYCFTPLIKKILQKEQDQHVCCMCQKRFDSSKQLRKHCFKKMTCRLRFVNALLKNKPDKVIISDANMDDSYNSQVSDRMGNAVSEILKPNEAIVLSSVKSLPISPNQSSSSPGIQKSKNLLMSEERTPYLEPNEQLQQQCHKCRDFCSDLADHLLKKSDCFDMYKNDVYKRPMFLCLCFVCKMKFTSLDLLKKHNCSPSTVYVHMCSCRLKFRSQQELKIHVYNSPACAKVAQAKTSKNDNLKKQPKDNSKANNPKHENAIEQLEKLVADMVPIVKDKVPAFKEDGVSTKDSVPLDIEDNDCLIIETPSAAIKEQPNPPLYPCIICDEQFVTLNLLMKHSHEHAEETPVTCERCKITFLRYNQFVSHQAFHIRMDKEALSSPEKQHPARTAPSYQSSPQQPGSIGSAICLFCNRQFPSNKAKVEHVSGSESCMGVIKYIVENKYFSVQSQNSVPMVDAAPDSKCCEFCHLPFVDKLSHYLQSGCLAKLEQAVAQYRAAIQTGSPPAYSLDAKKDTIGLLSNLSCDTVASSELQSGQEHFDQAASRGPLEGVKEFFCFSSMKSLKAEEISTHSASCRHCHLLPAELLELGCWENSNLRCKLCDTKYKLRYSLIQHIKAKHGERTTTSTATLAHAVVSKRYTCNMCSKVVGDQNLESHFKQHLTELIRFVRTSTGGSLKQQSTEYCILCNKVLSSKHGLILHFKRHQIYDMFKTEVLNQVQANAQKEDTSNLSPHKRLNKRAQLFYECKLCGQIKTKTTFWGHFRGFHSGICEEWPPFRMVELNPTSAELGVGQDQNSNSENCASINGAVSCRICNKVCLSISGFRNHFKQRHGAISPEKNVEDYFIAHKSLAIKPKKTKFRLRKNQLFTPSAQPSKLEDRSSETSTSSTAASVLKNDTPSVLLQKKKPFHCRKAGIISFPFQKKAKLTRTDAIGSCRLCHKYFRHMIKFKFHFKNSHRRYDPGEFHHFFNKSVCPGEFGNDQDGSLLQKSEYRLLSSWAHVCHVCRARFIDAASYHAHLKSHLKECRVLVDDIGLFAGSFPFSGPMSQIAQTSSNQLAELQATNSGPMDTYSCNVKSTVGSQLIVREHFPPDSTTSEDVANSSLPFASLSNPEDILTEQVVTCPEYGNLTNSARVGSPRPDQLSINVSSVSSTAHSPLQNQLLAHAVTNIFEVRLPETDGAKNTPVYHVPEVLCMTNSSQEKKTKRPLDNIVSEVLSVSDSSPESDFPKEEKTIKRPLETIFSTLQRKRSHSEGGVDQTEEESTSKKARLFEQDLINTSF